MARVSLNTIIVTHFCNSKQLPNFATLPVKSPMVLQLFLPQPHFKYGGKKPSTEREAYCYIQRQKFARHHPSLWEASPKASKIPQANMGEF